MFKKQSDQRRWKMIKVSMYDTEWAHVARDAQLAGMLLEDYARARLTGARVPTMNGPASSLQDLDDAGKLGPITPGWNLPTRVGQLSVGPTSNQQVTDQSDSGLKVVDKTAIRTRMLKAIADDRIAKHSATPIPQNSNDLDDSTSEWEVTTETADAEKSDAVSTTSICDSTQINIRDQVVSSIPRTRTRPNAHSSNLTDPRSEGNSVTLASLGAPARERGRDPSEPTARRAKSSPDPIDDAPWKPPEPSKLMIILADGTKATNMWLFANGCRITPADTDRILNTPSLRQLKNALLKCYAISLRKRYCIKWCEARNMPVRRWPDTGRSTRAFFRAAEFAAIEYARRSMTIDQWLDAAVEMKPVSLRFPTVDLLGSSLGNRVAEWLPPGQRERDKAWTTRADEQGTQWVDMPDGSEPVMVIRTVADRQRLLKMNKIR